jgi:signal transduction histidine kinase
MEQFKARELLFSYSSGARTHMNNTFETTHNEIKTVAMFVSMFLSFFACFIFDMSIALGVAAGVPYIIPILFTVNVKAKGITYLATSLAILLTIFGLIMSPEGGEYWKALINRAIAIFTIISVGLGIIVIKSKNDEIQERNNALAVETKRAVNASKAKSRFLNAMNHEFRTPLNIVLGYSQILKASGTLDHDVLENVDRIDKAGRHLLKMIELAISFAATQGSDISQNLQRISIISFVDDLIEQNLGLAEQHKITIYRKEIPEQDNITIKSVPTLLSDVLQIILENAIRYNKEDGSVVLTVESVDTDTIRVSVSDTGGGINMESHDEVFNPFSRLSMENSDKLGLGLGLAKAKLICDMLLIDINYQDKAIGTVFWLDIPVKLNLKNPS